MLPGAAAHAASQFLQDLQCPLNRPGTANTTPVVHTLHAASGSLHDICNSDQLASTFNTYLLVLLEERPPSELAC